MCAVLLPPGVNLTAFLYIYIYISHIFYQHAIFIFDHLIYAHFQNAPTA
jgi:hypothetical protein